MTRRFALTVICMVAALTIVGCGASRSDIPPGTAEADQFLFNRGQEELKERSWLKAREYFRQIVENYPQSQYRPDAKLAVGDTYIGEDTNESLLLAINEFREFLTFYPTNPRADYAQFRLARAYAEQMLSADRDQSATRDTIKELQVFLERYPNSSLMPEAKKLMREAKDRLSESSHRVGVTYYRMRNYRGAIDRFKEVVESDKEFTHRDATYYYLGETLLAAAKELPDKGADKHALRAEALTYYERLIKEFEQSDYLDDAQKRVAELKAEPKAQ